MEDIENITYSINIIFQKSFTTLDSKLVITKMNFSLNKNSKNIRDLTSKNLLTKKEFFHQLLNASNVVHY